MRARALLPALALLATASAAAWAQQAPKTTPLLKATTDAKGQPIQYPQSGQPEITSVVVEFPPGSESGRHQHPVPTYVYILEGSFTIEAEGGARQELRAGQAALEPANTWLNAKNTGSVPAKVLALFVGAAGTPVTVRDTGGAAAAGGASPASSGASGGATAPPGAGPGASPR
jgi:quercetin dioxygenase-like cupin family protein